MTAIATYGITGDPDLDGVLSGKKWAVSKLTFSFPAKSSLYGSNYGADENVRGFEAFTSKQAAAVRDILKQYAAVANVSFVEKTESRSVHADLRFAESDVPRTAWGYYPSTTEVGGDTWFNNSRNMYDAPVRGNYAWLTMLHEIGHTMGLKHPHEVRGAFNVLAAHHDSLEYTVMSYRSYVGASAGTGYTVANGSYPQTLMMLDIAAIQKLYGADFSTNAGDTVYAWNPTTGAMSINGAGQGTPFANKIFMTIWDGGGSDTYSFASYTNGVTVDLAPGAWSTTSSAQLANLGSGKIAVGNIANAMQYQGNAASLIENVIGGSGNDKISGNAADNKLTGGGGSDVLDGRGGSDTAVYSGASTNYSWTNNGDDSWTIVDLRTSSPNGTDTLRNIETMQFSDGVVRLGDDPTPVVEDAPLARAITNGTADRYSTKVNDKLVVKAKKGVLKNDADGDGDHLTATLVHGPHKGKLVLKGDGSFTYKPSKDFAGTVKFKYVAFDGDDTSGNIKATITVGASKIKKGHGGDVDHDHDVTEDQIPGMKGDAWQFNDTSKHSAWSLPEFPFQSGMLDGLNALLSSLGHTAGAFDTHTDLGLPDFSKFFAADHFSF